MKLHSGKSPNQKITGGDSADDKNFASSCSLPCLFLAAAGLGSSPFSQTHRPQLGLVSAASLPDVRGMTHVPELGEGQGWSELSISTIQDERRPNVESLLGTHSSLFTTLPQSPTCSTTLLEEMNRCPLQSMEVFQGQSPGTHLAPRLSPDTVTTLTAFCKAAARHPEQAVLLLES